MRGMNLDPWNMFVAVPRVEGHSARVRIHASTDPSFNSPFQPTILTAKFPTGLTYAGVLSISRVGAKFAEVLQGLAIFSFRIRERSVLGWMPRRLAAPCAPSICQLQMASARAM